ncbi:MAG: response regulator, partial [Chloroflexi bacterium]|nr:response regulator [Chloroflexota bacterium]
MIFPNGRVLVVDDDRPLVTLITTVLEDEGYAVQTALNGEEGLNLAKKSPPNLILMDLRMPIMDGWTCCRLLREGEETERIPVIVMSGDGAREAIRAELGIEDFLSKPFEIEELLRHVKKFVTPPGRRTS